MGFKKKTHEELVKQINIKTEFADKVFKKMRSDRYGLTFCCPLDLDKISIKSKLCGWDDLTVPVLPEVYERAILIDPSTTSCVPPGVFNTSTGLCESSAEAIQVGSVEFSYSNALPSGTPVTVEAASVWRFGRDCPIIMNSIAGIAGGGSAPVQIVDGANAGPNASWWTTYDATPGGPVSQQVPGVTETSFVNALARAPVGGWPGNTELSFSVPLQTDIVKNVYIFLSGDNAFGVKLNNDILIDANAVYDSQDYTAIQAVINIANGLASNASIDDLENAGTVCNSQTIAGNEWGNNIRATYSRGFIYPIRLEAGCNTLTLSNLNINGGGMFAFAVFDNTSAEIIASTQRSDLTELISSDTITKFYSSTIESEPWACIAPAILQPAAGNACPLCAIETNTISFSCPDGYTLIDSDSGQPTCFLNPVPPCDTETLLINVVNQNGEVVSNYDIIFDGGNYITDELGNVTIVIEDASINTSHTFNLCECFTTSGGCAVQQVNITVTDPDVETCTTINPLCNCIAPSFKSEVFKDPILTLSFTDANYASGNTVTAVTYTIYWRLQGQTSWNIISGLTMGANGFISYSFDKKLEVGEYEYKIKSICADEESNWSATNIFRRNL